MLPFLCVLKSSMEHICIYIYENLMQRGSVNAVLKVEHAIKTEAAATHDDDDDDDAFRNVCIYQLLTNP